MKYAIILISILILSSCAFKDEGTSGANEKDYYVSLREDCMKLSEYERGGCIASVNWMKQNTFRESLDGTCPSGYTLSMNKTRGSKRWCEKEQPTITNDSTGNALVSTPNGEKIICPPGMYPKGIDGCVKDPPSCPPGQTMTGFAGSQFCENRVETPSVGIENDSQNPAETCKGAGGTYNQKYRECSNITEISCTAIGGKFESCGSSCRHYPDAQICTLDCAIYCQL